MTTISFFVPGAPRGKQRPRFGKGFTYTPRETVAAEKNLAWCAKIAMGKLKPFTGPVDLVVSAYYERPVSWSKKRKDVWKTSVPDIDNVTKLVKDSLNGVVWIDDSQVVMLTATKQYRENPGTEITVSTID